MPPTPPVAYLFLVRSMLRDDLPFCDCRWLQRAAHDPQVPIEFDPELNEYQLKTAKGGSMQLYHCRFCAGRAPESLRPQMFAAVPVEETARLHELIKDIQSESDALRLLGEPTHVLEPGGSSTEPEKDDTPSYIHLYRTLRYESVSDTAVVDVHVDQYGKTSISLFGRYLGKPPKT